MEKIKLSKMLLSTAFILGFVLSSVESIISIEKCYKDKYQAFEEDIPDLPEDFYYDYDDFLEICPNKDLNQACTEKYSKENILKLDYEELVKKCGGSQISTAGFGKNISGKKIMCGYVLCLLATFGIVGNVMSMKVFWQPDMWKLKSGSKINQILFGKYHPI